MMLHRLFAAGALLMAQAAFGFELTLFDVELRSAMPATLHAAALRSGARLIKSTAGHSVYDASRMGIPGAVRLETLFDGDRFVIAAYSFTDNSRIDHDLRRLLVGKYGDAQGRFRDGRRYEIDLRSRYIDGVSATWDVEPPLELIYTNMAQERKSDGRYGIGTRLTYVNRALFDELQRRADRESKEADRSRAALLKGAL